MTLRAPYFVLAFLCIALPISSQNRSIPKAAKSTLIPNRYTVILADPAVGARFASREDMRGTAAAAYRAQIVGKQDALRREIESRGMRVTGSVTDMLNALFVTAPAGSLSILQSLPGVAQVTPMRRFKPVLNRATQLMNAPAAWTAVGGQSNAGAGIKIGLLDSGIDQTHPAFQDPSLQMPAGFPICTTGHPEDCAYTSNKVIVARSYVRQIALAAVTNPSNPAPESQPDDYSPRDRVGHGTATATCAAGFANTGAALNESASAVTFNGMAPKAYLGSYKVLGSPGVNDGAPDDVLIQAVEDAVSDGMDVISISLGSLALTGASGDPVAMAFQAAAQKAVVVAAAGNDGDDTFNFTTGDYPYFNSTSSPAIAPAVISVGATLNSHVFNPSVSVAGSSAPANLKNIVAVEGDSAVALNTALTAPLIDVTTLGDNGLACAALPAGSLRGAIALIGRGTCAFDAKAINAQTAGAVGVVFYMADSTAPIGPGGITTDFIGPTVMVAMSDGLNLKSHSGQAVTIDYSGLEQDIGVYSTDNQISPPLAGNQLASYSSVGPAPDGAIKPDMVAAGGADPGAGILASGMYVAAQAYDPNGELFSSNRYAGADGTSFATPLVAGAAALVKQAHPKYTPAQIKSALVNYAAQSVSTDDLGNPVDVQSIGAGLLDAGAAAGSTVQASPQTLSFGYLTKSGGLPAAQTVTLTNGGSSSVTLNVAVAPKSTVSGTTVTATPSSITLAAGATGTISVAVTGAVPSPGEYSGGVTLSGSGISLRLPYMFLIGDGTLSLANVNLISSFAFGFPGQNGGSLITQVIDQYGVPIAGAPVVYETPSRSVLTFQSYGNGEPACSPTSSSTSVTCNTDQFGFSYVEVVLGSQLATPTINITAAGQTFQGGAEIVSQPTISASGVLNDATFGSAIAPGSWVAIFGSNLLDTSNLSNYAVYNNLTYDSSNSSNSPADGSLPLQIDFVSVSFDVPSAGISVPGYLSFASQGQVNVWVPWELQGQSSVQMKVNVDEGFWGNVVTVPLSSTAPGFFLSGNVAIAQDQNANLITSSNPAARGSALVLYCNGLGPVSHQPASGQPASGTNLSQTTTPPVVTIGGQQAQVLFSGLTPGFVGLYQVNVMVPSGISTGNQPITIAIGGQTSPSQTAGSSPQTIVLPVK
jgi:uncharacterized protein (TIGR03437 family)